MGTVKRMKAGDLLPDLEVQASYADSDLSLSVSLASPCVFSMRRKGSDTPVIDRAAASVVSSTGGVVTLRYEWDPGDTDDPGDYDGEFELTISGEKLTVPTQGYLLVRIEDDLA